MPETFLNNLDWRHATKKFDIKKKISDEDLGKILKAIQCSPSSYGLQSYHMYVVSDQAIKEKIKKRAFLQAQIDTCSHLIVFCARTNKDNMSKRVDDYIQVISQGDKMKQIKLKPSQLMMKGFVKTKSDEDLACWAQKQCYIALGFALAACAELKIDSCPMEGFEKKAINKILSLPNHLESTVFLALGYRAEEPKKEKARFPLQDLFTHK